ncbi:MAG TPA: helix-turn-helix transcriptional regulator, partial [Candidatus Dormibacteraeota bacterium]|nr:helix-turn-helix transcriptional regulator [Candidatus Dormibacteraeota bacterium]
MDVADPSWGQVVAVLRVIRGWNQRQLADAAGVSGGAISRYEEGGRPAPVGRLAAVMGFPPHLAERTLSFLRWARAARGSHLAAGSLALPGRIEIIAGELGLWLETVAREGLAPAAATTRQESPTVALTVPAWWEKPIPAASRSEAGSEAPRITPLAQAILVLRVIRGWSRQQLAAAINSSEGTLANWERGTARPRIAMLYRIVDAMDFPSAMLGRALSFVQAARAAREWHLAGGDRARRVQAAHLAAKAAQSLEEFTRSTVALLVSAARLFES